MVRYWVCVCVELHISYISYHGRFIHILCKCHAGTLQSCYEYFICICLKYPERLPTHGYCILLALVWPNSSPAEVNSGLGWSMRKKLPSIARNIWSMSTLIALVSFYQIKTTLINVHDPTAQL